MCVCPTNQSDVANIPEFSSSFRTLIIICWCLLLSISFPVKGHVEVRNFILCYLAKPWRLLLHPASQSMHTRSSPPLSPPPPLVPSGSRPLFWPKSHPAYKVVLLVHSTYMYTYMYSRRSILATWLSRRKICLNRVGILTLLWETVQFKKLPKLNKLPKLKRRL